MIEKIKEILNRFNPKKLLSGDIFSDSGFLMKNMRFLLFMGSLVIAYIAFTNLCGEALKEGNQLNEKLLRSRTRYNSNFAKMMELQRYPEIKKKVTQYNIDIHESQEPPIKLKK